MASWVNRPFPKNMVIREVIRLFQNLKLNNRSAGAYWEMGPQTSEVGVLALVAGWFCPDPSGRKGSGLIVSQETE